MACNSQEKLKLVNCTHYHLNHLFLILELFLPAFNLNMSVPTYKFIQGKMLWGT
jgi:hypothetical protein